MREEPVIARLRNPLTAIAAAAMWGVARLLPSPLASRAGAMLLRVLGPLQRKHAKVLRNLQHVRPAADPAELRELARDMWSNLGAVLFEYPHVEHIARHRVTVELAPATWALLEAERPMLFLTGHLANWEVLASYLAHHTRGMVVVYSPNENPLIECMVQQFRDRSGCEYVTKQEALRKLTPRFLAGRCVGLLPDVRVDGAPSLPLFGVDAPTTISPARLAARLDYPLVPIRARRTGAARFHIMVEAPLDAPAGLTGKAAAAAVMGAFNRRLEAWIDERPHEWLCTKRRWPKAPAAPPRPQAG